MRKVNENKYTVYDTHTEIHIDTDKYGTLKVLIDSDDMEKCAKHKWYAIRCKSQNYKCFYISANANSLLIHRYIMDVPKGMVVDHINGNALDNRKENLRICTDADNKKNCKLSSRNKSGHKGVLWYHYRGINKWMAHICIDHKKITLGYFDELEDAIAARKEAEEKYFGEFARNTY